RTSWSTNGGNGPTTRPTSHRSRSTAGSARSSLPGYPMTELKDLALVFPDPPPSMLARTLDLAGQRWKAVANASIAMQAEPAEGWTGAIVCAEEDPEGAFALCRTLRKGDARVDSILLLVSGAQLHELEHRDDLFDDFCLSPFHPKEVEARFRHLLFRAGRG